MLPDLIELQGGPLAKRWCYLINISLEMDGKITNGVD